MKRFVPVVVLLAAAAMFATTGFQCGSAEVTSAKLYMQQKQWEKAEESLLKELAKNQKNEEAWFLLGQTRLERKNYAGMNEAYARTLELGDGHKQEIARNRLAIWAMMYNEGVALYNKGRDTAAYYDRAIANFNTAIAMVPDTASTYYVAALAHFGKRDYDGAVGRLEGALAKKPDYIDAARLIGQINYLRAAEREAAKDTVAALKYYEQAAAAFATVYRIEPGNTENIANLIDAYERSRKSEEALALTRDAVAREPNNKIFRFANGVFLLKKDKFAEAVEQFEKAVQIDPAYEDAVYNLGVAHLNWGVAMKQEADRKAEAQRKATGKEPKEDTAYKEQFKAALPYLERTAGRRGDDAVLWQQLARLYMNLNMVTESKAAFEKFDKLTKGK